MAEVTTPKSDRIDIPAHQAELAPIYSAARTTLLWGFRTGMALLAVGIAISIVRAEPLNAVADPIVDVLPSVFNRNGAGLIDLAILEIMATPVVTVLVVATGFFRIGDRRFGTLSLVVLAILAVSITLSMRK